MRYIPRPREDLQNLLNTSHGIGGPQLAAQMHLELKPNKLYGVEMRDVSYYTIPS